MERIAVIVLVLFAVLAAADERLSEADDYFVNRHKDSSYLSKSKELCEKVLDENPCDAEALWRLSRIYGALGHYEKEDSKKLKLYEKSKGYAERARAADPKSADAHYCYGVSLSRIIEVKGIVGAITTGMEIRKSFEKALEVDPEHTRALGALGIWYLEAPAVAGGEVKKSIELFKKALSIDPDYTLIYVHIARAYIMEKNYETARSYLNRCVSVRNPTSPADFYTMDKPQALRLLAEIEGK